MLDVPTLVLNRILLVILQWTAAALLLPVTFCRFKAVSHLNGGQWADSGSYPDSRIARQRFHRQLGRQLKRLARPHLLKRAPFVEARMPRGSLGHKANHGDKKH